MKYRGKTVFFVFFAEYRRYAAESSLIKSIKIGIIKVMIIGREKEQALLTKLLNSKRAEFLAIYGRRRIGKTFLINEFFNDKGVYLKVLLT